VPVVSTFQDMEELDHKATLLICMYLQVSWNLVLVQHLHGKTLLNMDLCLWLQHFKDMFAFTVSSKNSKQEKTVLFLS